MAAPRRTSSRARAVVASAALAAALALTGCSGGGEDPASGSAAGQGSSSGSGSDGGGGSDGAGGSEGAGGDGAGVEDVDLEDVLVEQTVAQPDDPDDLATVGVRSLRVEGDVMVLELVVTPDFASVSDSQAVSLYDIWRQVRGTFSPTLLDRANLKRYSVINAGFAVDFASDAVRTQTLNGRPMRAFAVYAAPEDDIDTIDVVLADVWPAFTDVPVER